MKTREKKLLITLSICVNVFVSACIIALLLRYYVFLPCKCRDMINELPNVLKVPPVRGDVRPLVMSRFIDVFKTRAREDDNSFALIFKHGNREYLLLTDGDDSMWLYSRNARFAWHLSLGENNSFELSDECRKRFSCQTISLKTSNNETYLNNRGSGGSDPIGGVGVVE